MARAWRSQESGRQEALPRLSVAICTHNRAALLAETLGCLARAERPRQHELEVLVVINACTDATADVVGSHARLLPIRSVIEPRVGLSHARNAAAREATGDFVLWTDDDVSVKPDWLLAYERAFLAFPEAAVFGGVIEPWFENGPPDWLAEVLPICEAAYAARRVPQGDAPIVLDGSDFPFGANFAIRGELQRSLRYDPRLGRRPGRRIVLAEEYELIRAVLTSGGQGRWVPGAVVRHRIPPERQTLGYLRRYYTGLGYTKGLLGQTPPLTLRRCAAATWSEVRFVQLLMTATPGRWMPVLIKSAFLRGELAGRLARSRRSGH
jgi:glycosyltransferase involved in cell wall biosynthesis